MKPLVWISAHDYLSAKISAENGADALLVGDSLGMTVYGLSSTREVTIEMMLRHTESVLRAVPKNFPVVVDIPLVALKTPQTLLNFANAMQNIGCHHLKMEGGQEVFLYGKMLMQAGIQITGHLGLLPQTAEHFAVAGKDETTAQKILDDACGLEKRGVKNIVLECVPSELAKKVTDSLIIPTIGIGAGSDVSGQILVYADIIGRTPDEFSPKFLRRFGDAHSQESAAIQKFAASVRRGEFPSVDDSYV